MRRFGWFLKVAAKLRSRVSWLTCLAGLMSSAGIQGLAATPSRYDYIAGTGDVTAQGDVITSIGLDVSVNLSGNAALTATVSGPNGTGSSLLLAKPNGTLTRLSFNPVSNRNYGYPKINDSNDVVIREQVSGGTPASLVRLWREGSSTIVASTTDNVYNSVTLPSLANDGGVSFIGLTGGSTQTGLYVNPFSIRGEDDPLTVLTGGGFRPMIGDDLSVVLRAGGADNSPIKIFTATSPGNYRVQTIALNATGSAPGISDDGTVVAFFGQDSSGAGIFLYDRTRANPAPVKVLEVGAALTKVQGQEVTIASLNAGARVAVEVIQNPFGAQYALSFSGTDNKGTTALYSLRFNSETQRSYRIAEIARANETLTLSNGESATIQSFSTYDPLTADGLHVFQSGLSDGTQAVLSFQSANFTKFKQGSADGDPLNNWAELPISSSNPNAAKFKDAGCFLTSVAMISSFFGYDATPLEFRDILASRRSLDDRGRLILATGSQLVQVGDQALEVQGRGGDFSMIVSSLQDGRPVMLSVPSSKYIKFGDGSDLHAIVAYGINPFLKPGDPVTADDIYVADPGNYSAYKEKYGARYKTGEETLDVTLADVFGRASGKVGDSTKPYTFDPVAWFNNGTFTRDSDGAAITLRLDLQNKDMTFFGVEQLEIQPSQVQVHSPLEVVLVDPTTGRRYVSASSLVKPGDSLLQKVFFDTPGSMPEDESAVPGGNDDPFPPYSLFLPLELRGRSLDVSLHGIGAGTYSVELITGSPDLLASAALTGSISSGQVITGSFQVVPEPGTATLLLSSLGLLAGFFRHRH